MRPSSLLRLIGIAMAFNAAFACRAQGLETIGFWVAGEAGAGSATINSTAASQRKNGFAMGLEGGYAFNARFSLGLRLHGCTLQASNLNDPAKGESLSQISLTARVYPWPAQGLFLRSGFGSLRYTNNRPGEFGGRGTGLCLGAGYEFPLTKGLCLAPVVDHSWGRLEDVDQALATLRNRRCRLLVLGISLRFS